MNIKNKRSWVEINLQQILTNIEVCQRLYPKSVCEMAVVKADAYGHGDAAIARFLSDNGIHHFAVSNIDEAIHIRKAGVDGQILILGYTPIERADELIEYDITQTLLSEEYAKCLAETALPLKCQFAIDTGMRRIGLNANDPDMCERVIREYAIKLKLNGLFTHLCVADTPEQSDFTNGQIRKFEIITQRISDLSLPYCHYMNSAGGLWYHSSSSSLVRLGIVLYGLKPDYTNTLPQGIEPVMTWKSVVSMIKPVEVGETIGYGRSFLANKAMRIATIPTGYADGYPRLLSNKGWVLIKGRKAHIVGKVCMDQMMIDVTDIPDVRMGTEVTLIGASGNYRITADDIAHSIGTIGYEIVCGINKRVDRVYIT